jgi:hypothetical protein
VLSPDTPETQTQYQRIVDIAEERDFSIDVAWGSYFPALEVGPLPTTTSMAVGSTRADVDPKKHNGSITVRVFNPLIGPVGDTQAVTILVWQSCPDLEVFGPTSDQIKTLTPVGWTEALVSQAEPVLGRVEEQAGDLVEQTAPMNAPTGAPVIEYVGGKDLGSEAAIFMHGDPVLSFRSCLKRYGYRSTTLMNPAASASEQIYVKWLGLTPFPGERTLTKEEPTDLVSYVMRSFAGFRGGYRVKAYLTGLSGHEFIVKANRASSVNRSDNDFTYGLSLWDALAVQLDQSWSGCQVTIAPQGNVVDVEIPWYENARFDAANAGPTSNSQSNGCELKWVFLMKENEVLLGAAEIYFAVADDWNCFFFRGVPEYKDTNNV